MARAQTQRGRRQCKDDDREATSPAFVVGLGRAFGGALLFALPMLMTMEMWSLGFTMAPERLALLLAITFQLLVGLSRLGGFRVTTRLIDDAADALVALAVAVVAAALILALFGLVTPDMAAREIAGKVALQAVPGSIGAMLARNQLGSAPKERKESPPGFWEEIFAMVAGALFVSLNVAPTEEMVLIAHTMSAWQILGLAAFSLLLMHVIVYAAEFAGGHGHLRPPEARFMGVFVRFTVTGYVVVVGVSFYLLWSFGRLDGTAFEQALEFALVLAFPGALGAAAARLVL